MLSIDYNDVFANETTSYLPVEMFKSYTTDRDAQIDEMFETYNIDWVKITFSILICILGLFGNSLTIFVIFILKEYKKSVTHWYVLQLAVADTVFLLTLPFKANEDLNNEWVYPNWMCKAKECILFINYYASILFLMIMSIDRYIAVCHSFSEKLQKFRRQWAASCITVVTWVIAILLCTPIAMYSTKTGTQPNCKCQYEFELTPETTNYTELCIVSSLQGNELEGCIKDASKIPVESGHCRNNYESQFLTITKTDYENDSYYVENSSAYYDNYEYSENVSLMSEEEPVVCDYSGTTAIFKSILYFNFFIMFLVPLIVMVLSYGLIIAKLHKTQVRTTLKPEKSCSEKRRKTKSAKDRRRVTFMCATLVVSFTLCWVLFHATHIAKIVGITVPGGHDSTYCYTLGAIGGLLGYLNSALNPYLYSFLGTNFSRRWSEFREVSRRKWFLSKNRYPLNGSQKEKACTHERAKTENSRVARNIIKDKKHEIEKNILGMQPVSLVHQLEAKNLLAKQVLCCQTQKIITTEMI